MNDNAADIWVLLGRRTGDNRQMMALAEATGLSWQGRQLRFRTLSALPNVVVGASLATLEGSARAELVRPWPKIVITAGKRAVPAARWIRKQSGGQTKLVHIGRPWAPLGWFDLVVTTAQYGLADAPNVVCNLMPLGEPVAHEPRPEDTPRLVGVLVGGNSRPLVLDAEAARRLAERALDVARQEKAALVVVTSPRTSAEAVRALGAALDSAHGVASRLALYGRDPHGYAETLRTASRLIVTDDSAAMLADAVMTGVPVEVFALPNRPDVRLRAVRRVEALASHGSAAKRLFDGTVEAGLISSVRDLTAYTAALQRAGLLAGGDAAAITREKELCNAAERVRALI